MKRFKLLLRFALSLLFGANIACAEVSGGFVGLEFGAGEANLKSTMISFKNNTRGLESIELITDLQTPYYGLIAGYKQFFNRYVGLRYYANINVLHFTLRPKSCNAKTCNVFAFSGTITMINYGANIDFMSNFYSGESVDFGGFVGFGIGANSWVGKGINNHERLYLGAINKGYNSNFKLTKTGFDCWVNLGFRTNFATNHSIEALARVPLLKTTLLKDKFHNTDNNTDYNMQTTIRNIYNISIRYAFSF